MPRSTSSRSILALAALGLASPALAHPHVWVTAKAEIVYAPTAKSAAIRHAWTFDPAYSAYVTQGLDKNGDGKLTPDELQDLAKENAESLVEFDYFTALKANGTKPAFEAPREYGMTFENGQATLAFVLPLKTPARADKALSLEIYDPSFFVSFSIAEGADAIKLAGAPKGCAATVTRPKPVEAAQGRSCPKRFSRRLPSPRTSARITPTGPSLHVRDGAMLSGSGRPAQAGWASPRAGVGRHSARRRRGRGAGLASRRLRQPPAADATLSGLGCARRRLRPRAAWGVDPGGPGRLLSAACKRPSPALKSDGAALWSLTGIGFAYGVFHAAGPGHGKAVIAGLSRRQRAGAAKGFAMSLAAALVQALVAIAIVGDRRRAAARHRGGNDRVTRAVEIASFASVAALGTPSSSGARPASFWASRRSRAIRAAARRTRAATMSTCRRPRRSTASHAGARRQASCSPPASALAPAPSSSWSSP